MHNERGLSVPDSEMLIRLSKILETPINTLLGENILEPNVNNLKVISEKLEKINLQVSKIKSVRIKMIRWTLISLCVILVIVFMSLILLNSPYLKWNYNNTETAVLGVFIHIFEWIFIRIAPFILTALVIILFSLKRKFKNSSF